jgi:hypothetical protein
LILSLLWACGPLDSSVPTQDSNSTRSFIAINDAHLFLTPENWIRSGAVSIDTNNPGAYFKTAFTGTSFQVEVDTSSNPSELPKLGYIVDGGALQTTQVSSVGSAVVVPLVSGLSAGTHQIRVSLEGLGAVERWTNPSDHLKVTGIFLDSGITTLSAPTLLPNRIVVYGDSITEGASTLGAANTVANKQWSTSWDADLAAYLDAEISVIAFQAQGYEQNGQGNTPPFPNAYSFIRSGVARVFSNPSKVFILHGTNGSTTQADVSGMMVNLRAAYPSAKLYFGVPFGGYARVVTTNAYSAQSDADVYLFDLGANGQNIVTGNSTDGVHPNVSGHALLTSAVETALGF